MLGPPGPASPTHRVPDTFESSINLSRTAFQFHTGTFGPVSPSCIHGMTMSVPILITTHSDSVHLLHLSADNSLTLATSLQLGEQPSFALPHPVIPNLLYVSSWVPNTIYAINVTTGLDGRPAELSIAGQTSSAGEGPTYFVITNDRQSLLIANVSGTLHTKKTPRLTTECLIDEWNVCAVSLRLGYTGGVGSAKRNVRAERSGAVGSGRVAAAL